MNMRGLEKLSERKLVPVIALHDAKDALPLAEALCAGGLPAAEITFRTSAAEASIRAVVKAFPDMMVGAGTLTTVDQARRARDAGASFFVTPGFSHKIVEFALAEDIPIYPGACTPTELMLLAEYGLPVAKFFPAQQFGGLDTIETLSAPFPNLKFMPTGGINAGNVLTYLASESVIACGGSWMVKPELIRAGRFDEIQALTRQAVELVRGAEK